MRLHEINTLEWDDLLVTNDTNDSTLSRRGNRLVSNFSSTIIFIAEFLTYFAVMADKDSFFNQGSQIAANGFSNDVSRIIS